MECKFGLVAKCSMKRGEILSQDEKQQIVPKEIPGRISLFRKLLIRLFGKRWVCSYCGKRYSARCHSDKIDLLMPVPQNGRCCPDGHEGYVVRFTGWNYVRDTFDYVENPP